MMKINLVPEVKQEQIRLKKINAISVTFAIIVGAVIVAIILSITSFNVFKLTQINSVENKTEKINNELKAYKDLEESVITLEKNLNDIKGIISGGPRWSKFFDELEKATPADIQIKTFEIVNNDQAKMHLEGQDVKSIDRFIKSFGSYKVSDSNLFTNVDVKSYTIGEKGVSFDATLSINKGLLWNQ